MELQIVGLNPVLADMVLREQLSAHKIASLVMLKELVDRYARVPYVSESEAKDLNERFGQTPDIRTWGDFFQTEIASAHFSASDVDFDRIIETVRFDLISSCMIFTDKPTVFFEEVEKAGLVAAGTPREKWTQDHEEHAHLDVLRQYFVEMNLHQSCVSAADDAWFNGFSASAQAV